MSHLVQIAGIVRESVVDGPGYRFVVFAQGCPHRCEGCHNPATHDFAGGSTQSPETLVTQAAGNPLIRGVTLSGGEPFAQAAGFSEIARRAHEAGLHVITYTGYTFEDLLAGKNSDWQRLLESTDILVDGPFLLNRKNLLLKFRGSDNQRVLDAPASLKAGVPVSCEF